MFRHLLFAFKTRWREGLDNGCADRPARSRLARHATIVRSRLIRNVLIGSAAKHVAFCGNSGIFQAGHASD